LVERGAQALVKNIAHQLNLPNPVSKSNAYKFDSGCAGSLRILPLMSPRLPNLERSHGSFDSIL
jgi:hypothetical protein